jgi:diguanylate cyclase (GGDEF)-like protein
MQISMRPQIIVAEDDSAARALLTRHLERAGYTVQACEDGAVALAAIQRQRQAIVVADWNMPNLDGIALCRRVRELCASGELAFVYVILLTANSEKDKIVTGLDSGADDYLTKPYSAHELLARLRAGERIYALQHELRERQRALAAANEQLTILANTDVLTGVFNRRYFFERLGEAWSLSRRHERPLACIMSDIDKFKSINDTYGHAAGDAALKGVAAAMRGLLRREDLLARFGGEEFCVLCPETDGLGAALLAERIRATVSELKIEFEGRTIPVTISLGAAVRRDEHAGPESVLAEADELLYSAKHNGRNQVWWRGGPQAAARFEPQAALT